MLSNLLLAIIRSNVSFQIVSRVCGSFSDEQRVADDLILLTCKIMEHIVAIKTL